MKNGLRFYLKMIDKTIFNVLLTLQVILHYQMRNLLNQHGKNKKQ